MGKSVATLETCNSLIHMCDTGSLMTFQSFQSNLPFVRDNCHVSSDKSQICLFNVK